MTVKAATPLVFAKGRLQEILLFIIVIISIGYILLYIIILISTV